MQREKCALDRRRTISMARRPSNPSVRRSKPPPPPPPPELLLELLLLELLLELDPPPELELPEGVVPEVMLAMQALLPALAGAEVVALVVPTTTLAESLWPWSSVTVTLSVTEPEVGAMTVAVAVLAPVIGGGLEVG